MPVELLVGLHEGNCDVAVDDLDYANHGNFHHKEHLECHISSHDEATCKAYTLILVTIP